jgi:hypothetical protein
LSHATSPFWEVAKSLCDIEEKASIAGTIGMRRSMKGRENPTVRSWQ